MVWRLILYDVIPLLDWFWGFKGGGRRGGVGCCAPPFSWADIVETVESTSKSGYWVCPCWSIFSGQDSNTSQ